MSSLIPALHNVSSDCLTARLFELRIEERHRLVEFLAYLAEVEERKVHLEMGFSSLFKFCTDHLGLSAGAAYRRVTSARLMHEYPVIAEYLADGRLTLMALVALRDVLTPDRLMEILDRAAGRSEEDVKALVAALSPKLEPVPLLRRIATSGGVSRVEVTAGGVSGPTVSVAVQESDVAVRSMSRVEPIGEGRRLLRLVVSDAFASDLDALRAELSHQIRDGDLEKVLHHALRVTLEAVRRRRRGVGRATAVKTKEESRHVPAAVRLQVWKRDGGTCAYVAPSGRRCNSTWRLELHHHDPFGKGGPSTVENLSLRCSAHNAYHAEVDYGREHMEQFRRRDRGG